MVNLAFLLMSCLALQLGVLEASSPRVKDMKVRSLDQIFDEMNAGIQGVRDDGRIIVEYDMALSPRQYRALYQKPLGNSTRESSKRSADGNVPLWPNNRMPYEFERNGFTSRQRDDIKQAFREIERFTCVTIEPKTSRDRNYVFIQSSEEGCNAWLGLETFGRQILNLEIPGCDSKDTYIHEALHSLGLVHEHQLWNRNDYLNIYLQNVKAEFLHAFQHEARNINRKRDSVPYSFKSIMHYSILAFTKLGAVTLYPKNANKAKFIEPGYEKPIAYSDVHVLNVMYNCAAKCSTADKNNCGRSGHLGKDCKCICEDGSQDCQRQKTIKSQCKNAFDNSWDCFRWAADGDCNNNKYQTWMSKYCASACGTCSMGLRTTESCINANREDSVCSQRAGIKDCQNHHGEMRILCAKSCKECNYKPPLTIRCDVDDYGAECVPWAKDGECDKNPGFMKNNCRKSCKTCAQDSKTCKNTHGNDQDCEDWASDGECEANPLFMKIECANACKTC